MKAHTYAEAKNHLLAEHVRELAALEAEWAVRGFLPSGDYVQPSIHRHTIYGAAGAINWNFCRYDSIRDGKNPDEVLLELLLGKFPPVSLAMVRTASSVSFRPFCRQAWGDRGETVTPVYPVTVRLNPEHHSQEVCFDWYAFVPAEAVQGDLWNLSVRFPLAALSNLGRLTVRYGPTRYDKAPVEECEFLPTEPGQRIRWASADRYTPNQFTVYYPEGAEVDLPHLARSR